jgi:hypothetical protein
MWMHHPRTAKMREFVDKDAIGDIKVVSSLKHPSLESDRNCELPISIIHEMPRNVILAERNRLFSLLLMTS